MNTRTVNGVSLGRQVLRGLLNTVLSIVALGVFFFAVFKLFAANTDAFALLAYFVGFGFPVVFLLASIIHGLELEKDGVRWLRRVTSWFPNHTSRLVNQVSGWFLALAAAPVAMALVLWAIPYTAGAEQGSVLLLRDGRVLHEGTFVRVGRFAPITTVADKEPFSADIWLRAKGSEHITVHVTGTLVLNENEALDAHLARNRSWVAASTENFMNAMAVRQLAGPASAVVYSVEQGRSSGSSAAMLLALRTLVFSNEKSHLPAWMGRIQVDSISVDGWSMSN